MKFEKGSIKLSYIIYILIGTGSFVLFLNTENAANIYNFVLSLLSPLFGGILLALCIDILGKRIRKWFFNGTTEPKIFFISTLISLFVILVCVITVLMILIPQLTNSAANFIDLFPTYFDQLRVFLVDLAKHYNINSEFFANFDFDYVSFFNNITSLISGNFKSVFDIASGAFSVVFNGFLMIVFALYIVFDKKNVVLGYKKFVYAIFSENTARSIEEITYLSVTAFDNFLSGQLLNAIFVAVATYLVLFIFQVPYSLLIATITGVFCLIPIIGGLLAIIPSGFILLVADPSGLLIYLVASLIISQVSGNIIFPKIMSEKNNLPGILVLLSITVFGTVFGVMGALLAIPFTSIVYSLYENYINTKLRNKDFDEELNIIEK